MTAETLDTHTTRVLAPNPGPMTLSGTNTYLVGAPGSGEVVCVDPGPDVPAHRDAVEEAAAARDAEITAVVLTHHHRDHAEAATWAAEWAVPLLAGEPGMIGAPADRLVDGQAVDRAGAALEAVATPGHASDHLSLQVRETGALLTGDHVLGSGTTAVLWPDGDMGDYMASLERVAGIDAPVLYPGHGPVVDRPREVISYYIAHRREREQQILAAVDAGARTPPEIVERVYADTDPSLHPVAERGVRAHLAQLEQEGRVGAAQGQFVRKSDS